MAVVDAVRCHRQLPRLRGSATAADEVTVMPRYEGRRTGMRLLALNAPLACCLLEGQRATNDAKMKELKTLMDTLDKEIDSLTEQQAKITATLEKTGIKVETNIPELAKERDNLRPEVTKLYGAMRALRGTFKKDNDTWWETEKVWRDATTPIARSSGRLTASSSLSTTSSTARRCSRWNSPAIPTRSPSRSAAPWSRMMSSPDFAVTSEFWGADDRPESKGAPTTPSSRLSPSDP